MTLTTLVYSILVVMGAMAAGLFLTSNNKKMNRDAFQSVDQPGTPAKGLYSMNLLRAYMSEWVFIIGGAILIVLLLLAYFGVL